MTFSLKNNSNRDICIVRIFSSRAIHLGRKDKFPLCGTRLSNLSLLGIKVRYTDQALQEYWSPTKGQKRK